MSQVDAVVDRMRQATDAFAGTSSRSSAQAGSLEMAQVPANVQASYTASNEPRVRSSSFYGSSYTPPPSQISSSPTYNVPYAPPPFQPAPAAPLRPDVDGPQAGPSSFYGFSYTPPSQIPPYPSPAPALPLPRPNSHYFPSPAQLTTTVTFPPDTNTSQVRPNSFHVAPYAPPPHTSPIPAPIPAPAPAQPTPHSLLSSAQLNSTTPFRLDTDAIVNEFIKNRSSELTRAFSEKVDAMRARGASQAEIDEMVKNESIVTTIAIAQCRVEAAALRARIEAINTSAEGSDQPPGYDHVMRERAQEAVQDSSVLAFDGRLRAEYEEVKRLKEVMNLAKLQGAPPEVVLTAALKFCEGVMRLQLHVEEDTDRRPEWIAHFKRQTELLERINRTTDPEERSRLIDLLDLDGEHVGETPKGSSACSWTTAGIFLLLGLAGMASQLALAIIISQGTQGTDLTLDRSLSVQVQCENLGGKSGSCDPPLHWSLFFGYGSPVIIIVTLLWVTCCDRKGKYNFTSYASGLSVACAIAAVVGSTLLAVKGYSKSDCSSCPVQAVYVPTSKLLGMNRWQATGAYATLIGIGLALCFAYEA